MTEEISIDDAAARLGVTRNTIKNMAARGDLTLAKKKFGKVRLFVPLKDVEALLKKPADELPKKGRTTK